MTEKHVKNDKKTTETVVNTRFLSCRGIVQRFLIDQAGYFFTVAQLRQNILESHAVLLNAKTIRSALKEIEHLHIGLTKQQRRTGRQNININFYTIEKK